MLSSKKIFSVVLVLLVIQVAGSTLSAVMLSGQQKPDLILAGVQVDGIEMGGLTKPEAEQRMTRAIGPGLSDSKITIIYNDKKWIKNYADLGITPEYSGAISAAFDIGREPNSLIRILNAFKTRRQGTEVPLKYKVDKKKVTSFLEQLAKGIDREPRDAQASLQNNQLIVVPETKGFRVRINDSAKGIEEAVNAGQASFKLLVEDITPLVEAEDLKQIEGDISIAVTTFDEKDGNRAENIRLAAKKLNNVIIQPGEMFSFNKRVGARTEGNGFREAHVIINNNLTDGTGGGVCQVSTTLYQASVMAGLDIVERHPHSLPPDYVPLGQDAAVADGQLDLKIKNNQDFPLLLVAYTQDSELFIRVMGSKTATAKASLITEIREEIQPKVIVKKDKNLPKGSTKVVDPGQKGYRVQVYRETADREEQRTKTLVSEDRYAPQPKTIRLGTKVIKNIKEKK